MQLDLLAFGAHPDDADIAYGGTLHKMARKGYKVGICDLTGGERGTKGTADTRKAELATAAEILGLAARENCSIPDTQVRVTRENQIKVARVVRQLKPRTVLLAPNDMRHPDHTAAERLSFEGCYFAGLTNFDDSLSDLHPFRPFKILKIHHWRHTTRPTFVVDITEELDTKIKAVLAFETQFPKGDEGGGIRVGEIGEWLRSRGRHYGMLIGKTYGEAFVQTEVMEVDDVVKLPVKSI